MISSRPLDRYRSLSMTALPCRVLKDRALAPFLPMSVLLFAPAPVRPAGRSQAPSRPPRLIVLVFSVSNGKGVPNDPSLQGVLRHKEPLEPPAKSLP
jgi:hypothetical protein